MPWWARDMQPTSRMPWLVGCWIVGIFVGMATEQPTRVWPAAVALSAGAASFLAGTIWFAHNAANHPRFHRTDVSRSALLRPRLTIQPSLGIASAGILTEIKF